MNEFVVHPSLSRTLLLNTAQDVGQDHFPTFSIFYGVGGLVIDCCLLIFAGFFRYAVSDVSRRYDEGPKLDTSNKLFMVDGLHHQLS